MSKFKIELKELVKIALKNSEKSILEQTPNPNYIGFGNPNANIIIFGKEKGFSALNTNKLFLESINNPTEWNNYILNEYILEKKDFESVAKNEYINVFYPYSNKPKSSGHTWNIYQRLINSLNNKTTNFSNEFLFDCFISEINSNPSSLSKIKRFKDEYRLNFLKNDFYQNFAIKILACGDYLDEKTIIDTFNIKDCKIINKSKPYLKLVIYKTSKTIVINTRQLSFNVTKEYIKEITEIINEFKSNN
jgi:hypothetical protein